MSDGATPPASRQEMMVVCQRRAAMHFGRAFRAALVALAASIVAVVLMFIPSAGVAWVGSMAVWLVALTVCFHHWRAGRVAVRVGFGVRDLPESLWDA